MSENAYGGVLHGNKTGRNWGSSGSQSRLERYCQAEAILINPTWECGEQKQLP